MSNSNKIYSFFIAGIIQGSKQGTKIYDQSYRDNIKTFLKDEFIGSDVFCPFENHRNSISYDDKKAEEVFLMHLDKVRESHALIVFLPEASLGTGIEMWEAHHSGRIIITISPMDTNWIIRILSDRIFPDIDSFKRYVKSGDFKKILDEKYEKV